MSDEHDQQTRTIEIPERTAAAISRRLARTGFGSVDAYAAFALDQLLAELHRQGSDVDGRSSDADADASDDDVEDSVEHRLESLGYL